MGIGEEINVLYAAVKPVLRKMYLNSHFSLQTRVFLYYTPPYVSFTKYREQMKSVGLAFIVVINCFCAFRAKLKLCN